jgi:wyosine [tRNA(Phe)-imidazoG37] synthetase (radical SAM superfamily)
VYCQIGRTTDMSVSRRVFYEPDEIGESVRRRLEQLKEIGETVDYLAIVPDGEPALDANLGRTIDRLKTFGIPVAVISNGSQIADENLRGELARADWVSLKVDAVSPGVWRAVDRPHGSLDLEAIHQGMMEFSSAFAGRLVTETMLISGINDLPEEIEAVAGFIAGLAPQTAYLSIPTRPRRNRALGRHRRKP